MIYYRENSVIQHFTDPKDTDLALNGKIIVGKFLDIDKPTFLDNQPDLTLQKEEKSSKS